MQNTKNATERAYLTQKILSDAGLNKGVALAMQSVDLTALASIKRDNISLETYMELQRRFTRDGVETYSDLILGLPGETYESFADGVQLLIETGQHNRIQFNNLSILPNAEMGDPAYQKKFGMVTVESKIINIHGERVELEDDVPELQDLVVATHSMPRRGLAPHARLLLDHGASAFRQALPDPAHRCARAFWHTLSRDVGGVSRRRREGLSAPRPDPRLLPRRGARASRMARRNMSSRTHISASIGRRTNTCSSS